MENQLEIIKPKHLNNSDSLFNYKSPGSLNATGTLPYSKNNRKAIVFIDGNNFYHNIKRVVDKPKEISFIKLAQLISKKFYLNYIKINYYNSTPSKTDPSYKKHNKYLENLKLNGINVKTRELHGKKEYKREKGIDILIAVDMIDNCLIKKECDVCILITGDADFIPVIELIKKAKKEVIVSSIYYGFSQRLREGNFRYYILKSEDLKKIK